MSCYALRDYVTTEIHKDGLRVPDASLLEE